MSHLANCGQGCGC